MAKAIKKVIPSIIKPAFNKRGFAQAQIILDWEKIVGPHIAQYGIPERISYYKAATSKGTLVLAVTPGWAPIINHGKQQIMDRINSYFGYEAVNRLQLKQTLYIKPRPSDQMMPNEKGAMDDTPLEDLTDITDPDLRQALAQLKRSIHFSQKAKG